MPEPSRLSTCPVRKTCVASVSRFTGQIDAGKDARLRTGAAHRLRHDMGLLEIEHGGAERQQAHPDADAKQIRRAEKLRQRGQRAAADALVARLRAGMNERGALKPINAEHRQFEHDRRRDQQVGGAERRRQPDRQNGAEQRAGGAARGDDAVQALPWSASKISAMKYQNTATANRLNTLTQTKNTGARWRTSRQRQQQPEQREIGDKEGVHDGQQPRARQPRHQRAEERARPAGDTKVAVNSHGSLPLRLHRPSGRGSGAARSNRAAGKEVGERPEPSAPSALPGAEASQRCNTLIGSGSVSA